MDSFNYLGGERGTERKKYRLLLSNLYQKWGDETEERNKGKFKQTVLKTGKVSGSKHVFLERSDTYILPH